jgi:phosphatidylglycerol lysyltransferase
LNAKTLDRLSLAVTLALLFVALYVLYRDIESVRLVDVVDRLRALPKLRLAAALSLTALSYLLLTGYDFLALRYVGRELRIRDVLLASFTGFAFSNNLGFALLSGGSVRYRIYSGLGVGTLEIAAIVLFCSLTYALGFASVGGLMLTLDPRGVAADLDLPRVVVRAAGLAMLGVCTVYLAVIGIRRGPIPLGRYRLRLPTLGSGLMQIAIASLDLIVAGTVCYVLLPPEADVAYGVFLAIYVLAGAASLVSLVPGGLGVFETVILTMLTEVSKAGSLSALVAYRAIYFLLPLALASLCLAVHEARLAPSELGWREKSARDQTRQ